MAGGALADRGERRLAAEAGAPRLGLAPNGVSALAVRAREGLRRAYLQVQIPEAEAPTCRDARQDMGSWLRADVSSRRATSIAEHLEGCPACHGIASWLAELNRGLGH